MKAFAESLPPELAQGSAPRRIRIAYVALSARGGTALYSTGIAKRMASIADVLYVAPKHLPQEQWPAEADCLPVQTGRTHREVAIRTLCIGAQLRLIQSIRNFQPDIVHFLLSHPWNPIIALGLRSMPLIVTVHDPLPHTGAKWIRVTQATHRMMYRLATRVVVLCNFSREALPAAIGKSAAVIPHPIFDHYRLGKYVAKSRPPRAVFFGRFQPYKGLDTFYGAARQLVAEGVEGEFVFAGPGELPECLQGAQPKAITVINRFMEEREVAELLASATMMVLPYKDATQSGVLAAAYAAHLPVIATRVGSFPEYIGDGISGLLVKPNDAEDLAAAIRTLLRDEGLQSQLSRGAAARSQTMSWDEIIRQHVQLYDDVRPGKTCWPSPQTIHGTAY